MTCATDYLGREHRLIEVLLDDLESLIEDARCHDRLEVEQAAGLLECFEHFVDGSHQEKEEECLFPVLSRRASGWAARTIARLADEHREERAVIDEMRRRFEGAAYGDLFSLDTFVVAATRYARMVRDHLSREDRVLLPIAEHVLRPADDRALVDAFREIDARRPGRGSRARAARLAGAAVP